MFGNVYFLRTLFFRRMHRCTCRMQLHISFKRNHVFPVMYADFCRYSEHKSTKVRVPKNEYLRKYFIFYFIDVIHPLAYQVFHHRYIQNVHFYTISTILLNCPPVVIKITSSIFQPTRCNKIFFRNEWQIVSRNINFSTDTD